MFVERLARTAQTALTMATVTALGCANSHQVSKPERAVLEFAQALAREDYDTAYGLMSADYRAENPLPAFRQQLQENEQETSQLVDTLIRPSASMHSETRLRYHGLEQAVIVHHEDSGSSLDGSLIAYYDQSSPRKALEAFVRAASRQRYDVLLRLLPNEEKVGLGADSLRDALVGHRRNAFTLLLEQLKQAQQEGASIEQTGQRATMAYGEHGRVQFVLEGNRWKVESLE